MFNFIKNLVLNATSKQVKKVGLFGYPSINSLAMIIFGCYILFYCYIMFCVTELLFDLRTSESGYLLDSESLVLGLVYVTNGLFVLFLLIAAILFSLNQFRKLKMPKLCLRTPKGSLETENGSKYTPLISDV